MGTYFVLKEAEKIEYNIDSLIADLDGHVVSLVGGGGKTSIICELSEAASRYGKKVLVLTTTHMMAPEKDKHAFSMKEVTDLWEMGAVAWIGEIIEDITYESKVVRKLSPPDNELMNEAISHADIVFIEADGAKGKPCKLPRKHEPVIIPQSDIIIGVMGMDALEGNIMEQCFLPEMIIDFLRVHGDGRKDYNNTRLNSLEAAMILMSKEGTGKDVCLRDYWIVLNKCDLDSDGKAEGICKEINHLQSDMKTDMVNCSRIIMRSRK